MTAVLPADTRPRHEGASLPERAASTIADLITGVPGFGPRPLVTLVWDDGARHSLRTPTLFGRNPRGASGWQCTPVRDETLSLSRTHLAFGGVPGAAWVADTHSTNGTEIVRDGRRHRVSPGERWIVRAGDILEVGDRRVSIEGV